MRFIDKNGKWRNAGYSLYQTFLEKNTDFMENLIRDGCDPTDIRVILSEAITAGVRQIIFKRSHAQRMNKRKRIRVKVSKKGK